MEFKKGYDNGVELDREICIVLQHLIFLDCGAI